MGADQTDQKLFEMCLNKIDLDKVISNVERLSKDKPVLLLGIEEFDILYPGKYYRLLSIDNTYLPEAFKNYEDRIINFDRITEKIHVVYIGLQVGGFKLSGCYKYYKSIEKRVIEVIQPIQNYFSENIPKEISGLINPYFKDNRKIGVSFVILSGLNNEKSLSIMLDSFKRYTPYSKDIEVIIVVNGSNDSSAGIPAKILGNEYSYIVINCPDNIGISCGFNEGIAIAQGKYICLLQDDITFSKINWYRELSGYLDKYPNIGIIGGYRAGYYFKLETECALENPYIGVGSNVFGYSGWDLLKTNLVKAEAANCMAMMFRKELGKFDEEFIPNGLEDIAFSFEVRKKGYDVYVTDVGICHDLQGATRISKADKSSKLSRAYHFKYFIDKYGDMLNEIPKGIPIDEINLSCVEKTVHTLPKEISYII